MLISSSNYSKECFLSTSRLFIDSCTLISWANDPQLNAVFEKLSQKYSIVISTVSIMEVGFGPTEKASEEQKKRAKDIYLLAAKHPLDNQSLHLHKKIFNKVLPGTFVYNPNHHEWYASRNLLIKLMNATGKKGDNARELVNDSLIYHCAWNSQSALITDNIKDFILLNSFANPQKTSGGDLRHVPIFTLNDLINSINSDISYPENLPKDV